jgi:zinc transport system substrate-binding protein
MPRRIQICLRQNTRVRFRVCALVCCAALCFSCGAGEKDQASPKPLLALSIIPQEWFAGRIAGDFARFLVLAGPGQNPHSYEPAPQDIALLVQADCWILSGTEFEISLVPKIASQNPSLKIIDGTRGMRFRALEAHHHDEDAEDGAGETGRDRHTWLGREQAIILSGHILSALEEIDGGHGDIFKKNYQDLVADINRVFDELKAELLPLKGRKVFVYHPAFGYFLDEFGIVQEAVEIGGKEPTPRALRGLIAGARAEKAAAIFVQAQFPAQSARTVAQAVGAEVVALDPLAPLWLDNIRAMGNALLAAVQP